MKLIDPQGIVAIPGTVPTGNLVWVDAVSGNDSLARRGCLTVPFKTLTAAKNAAQAGDATTPGDTIVVMPGLYNERNLLKSYVNWFFLPGAVVKYSGGNGAGAIFDNSSSTGVGTAIVTVIGGLGEFISDSSAGTGHVLYVTASGSNITLHGKRLNSSVDTCVYIAEGSVDINVYEISSSAGTAVRHSNGGCVIRSHLLFSVTGGNALKLDGGTIDVLAYDIVSSSNPAISCTGGTGTISAREVRSSSSDTIEYNSPYNSCLLKMIGTRIVSQSSTKRCIWFQQGGNATPSYVRLDKCVLISAGTNSINSNASAAATVLVYGLFVANKVQGAGITLTGATYSEVGTHIV